MVTKITRIDWERLLIAIARLLLPQFIRNFLNKRYIPLQGKRECNARIVALDVDKYLDVSYKPNLNVIILVIDCLRNSNISANGYFRKTTPFIDSIQCRFNAISAAPWTYSSVVSILTGLYPHNHNAVITGRIKNFDKLLNFHKPKDSVLTLPEMLFLLGYRTYFATAIDIAYYPLRGRVIPVRYEPVTRADNLLRNLTRWISKNGKGFFAYVHLGDLHEPIIPPDNFRHFFGNVKNFPNIGAWDFRRFEEQRADARKFREYRENRILLYDNTLRYVDEAIKRFHGRLEEIGLLDSTILLITSDHGEEFWEHADLESMSFYDPRGYHGVGHGHNVFNEIIEVPLLITGPVPNLKSNHFVSTVDVLPTILDLLGINHKMTFDGQNIFNTDRERPLLIESSGYGHEKKALIVGRYKLIYSKDDGVEWLFDLEKDPREQHPIVDKQITAIFVERLNQLLKEDERKKVREITAKKKVRGKFQQQE